MDERKDTLSQITRDQYGNSYRDKIVEKIGQIEDEWILKTIHNFIVGMTKEGG